MGPSPNCMQCHDVTRSRRKPSFRVPPDGRPGACASSASRTFQPRPMRADHLQIVRPIGSTTRCGVAAMHTAPQRHGIRGDQLNAKLARSGSASRCSLPMRTTCPTVPSARRSRAASTSRRGSFPNEQNPPEQSPEPLTENSSTTPQGNESVPESNSAKTLDLSGGHKSSASKNEEVTVRSTCANIAGICCTTWLINAQPNHGCIIEACNNLCGVVGACIIDHDDSHLNAICAKALSIACPRGSGHSCGTG